MYEAAKRGLEIDTLQRDLSEAQWQHATACQDDKDAPKSMGDDVQKYWKLFQQEKQQVKDGKRLLYLANKDYKAIGGSMIYTIVFCLSLFGSVCVFYIIFKRQNGGFNIENNQWVAHNHDDDNFKK